jgi:hypothetical protein
VPDSGQVATLFWLAVLGCWGLTRADVRAMGAGLARQLLQPKLSIPIASYALWIGLLVVLGSRQDPWTSQLAADEDVPLVVEFRDGGP